MNIVVNGQPYQLDKPGTIDDVVSELQLDSEHVVIEHNRVIIPRPKRDTVHLQEGDTLEIIHFVGGG